MTTGTSTGTDATTLTSDQIIEIPFDSPEFHTNPLPYYQQMRQAGVKFSPRLNAWVISRYADVDAALKNKKLSHRYNSESSVGGDPALALFEYAAEHLFFFMDEEMHRATRPKASPLFAANHVKYLEDMVRQGAHQIIDGIIERHPDRQFDFLHEFAFALPMFVICQLLGIDDPQPMKFVGWVYKFMGGYGLGQPHINKLNGAAAMAEMYAYFYPIVEERRANPTNDYISKLATLADEDGNYVYSTAMVIFLCINLILGGFETASSTLSTGLPVFLDTPDQWVLLGQNPDLAANAAEEILRYTAVVRMLTRLATEDVVIGGVTIPAGSRVAIFLPAANHDETVFTNPDLFDLMREFNQVHLAFGNGPHICLGAALARLEITVALEVLSERFPELRVVLQTIRQYLDVSGVTDLTMAW